MCHHTQLIFIFLVEMRGGVVHGVGQAGLQLLTSGDSPSLASQSTGITDESHHAWQFFFIFHLLSTSLTSAHVIIDFILLTFGVVFPAF